MKVHAIQTGLISVKENFLNQKGQGLLSKLNIVFGNSYADFMPIWVWVIEHPEGVIVIDTGDIEESCHKEFEILLRSVLRLNQQHRVPIIVKPVFVPDRLLICFHNKVIAGECRNQNQQTCFGKMKICN